MGGGGTPTSNTKFEPPSWTASRYEDATASAQALANRPYQQSGLPTVAPLNNFQQTGNQMMYDRAVNGAPDINAARGAAMNFSKGNMTNPWAQNVSGIASGQAYNPFSASVYSMGQNTANPFASPQYSEQMIANTAGNMANSFASGTAAQNDAMAAQGGAFGGSAWQQKQTGDAAAMAKQVGDMAAQTRSQQQQYMGNMYNTSWQNSMQALMNGSGMYQGDVSNQLNANAQGAGIYGQDLSNILAGGALAGQLSQDDYTSMSGLMNAGNNYNSYTQKLLDAANNQYSTQQGYDDTRLQNYLNVLGQASGGYGGSSTSGAGQNNLMNALGLGVSAYGAYKL